MSNKFTVGVNIVERTVRLAFCGLGSIGSAAARLLLDHRTGFDLVGAVTKQPEAIGRQLHDVVSANRTSKVVVGDDLSQLLEMQPDVVIYSTGSFLSAVREDVERIAAWGSSLVSPCEELAFPFIRDPEYAKHLNATAVRSGATVLGTGVNPGFIFDGLLAAATGSAWDVTSITGQRVVDVSGFAQNIHLRLGIGYTEKEFNQGHTDGTIAGHVGFTESIQLVAERLGMELDGPVEETFKPMIAEASVSTPYGGVAAGYTEGFIQKAMGRVGGKPFIELELLLHLRPTAAGYVTSDRFSVEGEHPIHLEMRPGMDAILATSAQLVNAIPAILKAQPGLKTINDLPAAAAWTDLSRTMFR
jgi:4-hydroxy-tetrahydrodipicolinate reductase